MPVVTTDAGGIPMIVSHGHTALLGPVDDAAALADQVRRVLADPALARTLAAAGREAIEEYTWPRVRAQWAEAYAMVRRPAGRGDA